MALTFKELVEKKSNGAIKVQIFPENQLGSDAQSVALVKKGIIQMAISAVGGIANQYPMISAMDFPFAFHKVEEAYAVFDGPFGQRVRADIEAQTGIAVMGFGDTGGLFVLTNSKHPIFQPSDMKGLRIRTMASVSHQAMVRSLGAEPVTVRWDHVYDALQTGLADGQMNSITTTRYGRLHVIQKYMSVTNHAYVPFLWTANPEFLASLSPSDRQLVSDAVTAGIHASRELAIKATGTELQALLPSVQINYLTDAELKEFSQIAQPPMRAFIAEKYGEKGTQFLDDFLAAVDQTRQQKGKK
jgi:tripartite ATP-independent transporter DctP family solute receptor